MGPSSAPSLCANSIYVASGEDYSCDSAYVDDVEKCLELELLIEKRSSTRGSQSVSPTSRFFGYLSCADGHSHIFKSGIFDDDLPIIHAVAKSCMKSTAGKVKSTLRSILESIIWGRDLKLVRLPTSS